MLVRENELKHYGVKGMKWHQHLKRHEEPLLDRLGRDEKKDLEEARNMRRASQNVLSDIGKHYREDRKSTDFARKQGYDLSEIERRVADERATYWNYKEQSKHVQKRMAQEQIAQWHYDKTVMGKIDKGKKKVAEFLKKGFKR